MVEITASRDKTEATRREFILGDTETIRHDLGERGRASFEWTGHQLEETVPQIASEMTGERETLPLVHATIKDKSANLQINTRVKIVGNVEASLKLENSEQEGEIVSKEIKANPPKKWFINIQGKAEEWGKRVNTELEGLVVGSLRKRGIKTTGAKFWFTENDTLRIQVEDEERLRELEAQVIPPEGMEIISPRPAEPKPEKKPEIITVVAKELASAPETQELTPLEKLKQDVSLNREKLEASFEDFINRDQTGEQLEETLDRYTTSLFALNRFLNRQINPESIRPGFSEASDEYWSSNDTLKSLEKDLGDKKTALRTRYLLAQDYFETLTGRGEDMGRGNRTELFNRLLKQRTPSQIKVGKIEAKVSPQEEGAKKPGRPEFFGVPLDAKHYEFVGTFNPKTGKGGHFIYFWAGGEVKLRALDEGGRELGNEFVVKSKVDSLEEVNSLIQEDVKKYETKGLQITRNVLLEIFEETRRKELQGLTLRLKGKREKFTEALENYEDARLNYRQAKEAPQKERPSTIWAPSRQNRIENVYWKSLKTATREQKEAVPALEKALLAFNSYLDKNVRVEALGGDKDLFERYQRLGGELEKLQEKSKVAKTRQKVNFLREFDRLFNDRLGVFIQITEQRGLNLGPAVKQEGNFVSPVKPPSDVQVQEIIPTITMKGEDGVLVGASFLSPNGAPSKPYFGELKRQLGASSESKPSQVLERWKELKGKGILVVPWIWRSEEDDKLLTADLSEGARLDVTDFDFLALHLRNYGGGTESLPSWLVNNRGDIRDKLVRNAELVLELKYLLPPSSYRLLPDRKDGPPTVFLSELSQVVEGNGSKEEIFRQNLDLIFDTLVRRLHLFTEEEWKSWWYEKVYLPKLKKAA